MKKIFPLLLLITILVSSCAPKSKNCTLTRLNVNGDVAIDIIYQEDKVTSLITYNTVTGLVNNYFGIFRDGNGRIDHVDSYFPGPILNERRQCYYDSKGRLGSVYFTLDQNNDGYPEQLNSHYEYAYNTDNNISEIRVYDAFGTFVSSSLYTWANGNMSQSGVMGAPHVIYTYDDKRSYLSSIELEYYLCTTIPQSFSVNNTTVSDSYDASNSLISTYTTAYTYNSDGYPESDDHGLTYEYNCVEVEQ